MLCIRPVHANVVAARARRQKSLLLLSHIQLPDDMHWPSGGTHAQQAAALASPLDILVATPQKLLQHAEKGNVFYGDVQFVVLDEADTMFDRGFGPEVESVLGPLRSKPEPAQCILVAATLTKVTSICCCEN